LTSSAIVLGALACLVIAASPSHAHWADLAVAEVAVRGTSTNVTLTFPTGLVRFADDNRDGHLSSDEVERHRVALERALGERIRLTDGAQAGRVSLESAGSALSVKNLNVTTGTHTTVVLAYTWFRPVRALTIHYDLFEPGVSTASCLATILQDGGVRSIVFTPEHREFTVSLGGWATWDQGRSFFGLGLKHILTGYDHVLFLLSLLVVGGGLRYLVKVASAFTVAHSITLSLAVLNVVTLPSRWVESLIALSIVYVAAENVWRAGRAPRDRWVVTCGFGLVHGLGFASILKEFAVPRSQLALSLVSFNLGVEAGQIAIVLLAAIVLPVLSRWPGHVMFRRLVSASAAAVGLVWFIQRAFLS
jgi:hydrogenase/urease accessory protein HupE